MIVDDEFLIRVGLQSTIPWEDSGYHLVGTAKNAVEAMDLFKKHHPHIVITDIAMPETDGLTLIKQIKEIDETTHFIVLTHYQSFEYAKGAIKLGVAEYLLKSEANKDNILNILKGIEVNDRTSLAPQTGPPAMSRQTLSAYLRGENALSTSQLDTVFINAGFHLADYYALEIEMLYKHPKTASNVIEFDKKYSTSVIENMVTDVLPDNVPMLFLTEQASLILFIGASGAIPVAKLCNMICSNLNQYFNMKTLTGISAQITGFQRAFAAHKQAVIAKNTAYFSDAACIQYDPSQVCSPAARIDMSKISSPIVDRNEFFLRITDILNQIHASGSIQVARRSLDQFRQQIIKTLGQSMDDATISLLLEEFPFSLSDMPVFSAYRTRILSFCETVYSQAIYTPKSSYVVQKCIDYIHAHYASPISLASISDEFGISYSYLSYLFVKETKQKMHNYINNVRIDHAKALLRDTDKKIYEIAHAVGYDSPYYFSKIFNKITGKTCSEYRKGRQKHS